MINSGKDKNHSEKNKRKTEKKSARISFEFFVEKMLSGREQELAGRLREAASQVIGSDHDDQGDESDVGDEGCCVSGRLRSLWAEQATKPQSNR